MAAKAPPTARANYAGLKILPQGAFQKISVPVEGKSICTTHYRCAFVHPDGATCNATFPKSTSLIVHYQQHIALKPFMCTVCGTRYAQSGTLVRHNRAIHGVDSIAARKQRVATGTESMDKE